MKPPVVVMAFLGACLAASPASAQSSTFAGDAQHTARFSSLPLHLNHVRWSALLQSTSSFFHYGAPLVSASNTVFIAPISNFTYTLQAYEGATGRLKYSLTNDFRSSGEAAWGMTYGPVLTIGLAGARLYYPGAGGTVFYIENPDSDTPSAPARLCPYEPVSQYSTNATNLNNAIYVNTPITADTNGTIFFGFRTFGTAPAPLSTTSSGFARIAQDGTGSYVLTTNAAKDTAATLDTPNCAPTLSNDGATLYVVVNGSFHYLVGLDAVNLTNKYRVQLRDPRFGGSTGPANNSTASPTVGPDGDIYFGVSGNGSMGYMLHFSGDLATQKLSSVFGWDYTAAILPTNIVKGYRGPSSYLLFSKYNNYSSAFYRNAILDPNAGQVSGTIQVMREVLTVTSPSSGSEWCVSTPAVCAPGASVFSPNEDGRVYRWDLSANSLVEALSLHSYYGEPYVSTVQGPDGALYTISGNRLYALDNLTNLSVTASSSNPDERMAVVAQPITFTAVVTNPATNGPSPTGAIDFLDGSGVIATNVALVSGVAATTTSNLTAGAHFINVKYSGDASYPTGAVTLIQRIHAKTAIMTLTSSVPVLGSNSVTFTASVTSPAGGTPSGMVAFWDRNAFLLQVPLASGNASFTLTNFPASSHAIQAEYSSDSTYTACSGALMGTPPTLSGSTVTPDGSFQFSFTGASGAPYSVLGTIDVSAPLSSWQVLGPAVESPPGQFQFTDPQALTLNCQHFYAVRSP